MSTTQSADLPDGYEGHACIFQVVLPSKRVVEALHGLVHAHALVPAQGQEGSSMDLDDDAKAKNERLM